MLNLVFSGQIVSSIIICWGSKLNSFLSGTATSCLQKTLKKSGLYCVCAIVLNGCEMQRDFHGRGDRRQETGGRRQFIRKSFFESNSFERASGLTKSYMPE